MRQAHITLAKTSLTRSQVRLLALLYKFRFITTDIAAAVLQKDRSTLYERFALLVSRGYVVKHYDPSYRLAQKAARYSLSTKGIAYLRKHTTAEEGSLRRHYGNKTADEALVDSHIQNAERYTLLAQALPDHDMFTNYELTIDNAIRPFPHLYAQPKQPSSDCYYLDYVQPFTPTWLLRKRLVQHQDAEDEVEHIYPHVLLVVGNDSTERRLLSLTESGLQDFRWYITTNEQLHEHPTGPIWIDGGESTTDDIQRVSLK